MKRIVLLAIAAAVIPIGIGRGQTRATTSRVTSAPCSRPRIRVACLGDSITAGARTKDRSTQSYPARLQALLGEGWHVRNFGIGGATLLRKGRPNIWKNVPAARQFNPHVIIIMLGTNDTVSGRRHNWERIDEFPRDYKRLIATFRKLPARPAIYCCSPTAMVLETPGLSDGRRANLTERKPRLQQLRHRIEQIARQQRVHYLDLQPLLAHRPDLIFKGDGVHPNVEGYQAIAQRVFEEIKTFRPGRE